MAIALYVKKFPKKKNVRAQRMFYSMMTGIGALAILFALLPFFTWQFFVLPKLTGSVDTAPVPKAEVLSAATMLAQNVQVVKDADGFSYFTTTDPKPSTPSAELGRPEEFSISIPKLKIKDANVVTDSTKFDQHLGHFPGTAIPGQIGNAFITGHSVLPEFFDAKNYRTIFSHLSDLEIGDDISVDVAGKTYHYIVQYSKIVDPRDTSVLLPLSPTGRNLTLMSCVPPGTSSKRLVVISSLI
jgi:sortase A